MLTDFYRWFTEGFDTADLKDAKPLLGEMAGWILWSSMGHATRHR
jgi:hypothetical protein